MDERALKVEKHKASIEKHKAYLIYWQTQILSGRDKNETAWGCLLNHANFINEGVERILGIE